MYFYVIEFGDFEDGLFTATRFPKIHPQHPPGAWVCGARDDTHALELAKRAATKEWPTPTTRKPLEFVVRFVDPLPRAGFDRRL